MPLDVQYFWLILEAYKQTNSIVFQLWNTQHIIGREKNMGFLNLSHKLSLIKKTFSSGPNCESKPFSNPLEHTQKISSKSVQSFRRSSVTYTRTQEIYILRCI